MRILITTALAGLLACSNSSPAKIDAPVTHDAHPDGHTDAPPDVPGGGPNAVTVDLAGVTPDLIAYRDGSGPWQTPVAAGSGLYTLHVTNAYEVLAVCDDAVYGPDTEFIAYTFTGEGATVPMYCGYGPAVTTVAITGHMVQAGSVDMQGRDSSTTANWQFHLDVSPGQHELIANNTTRVLIRHDQNITTAATLPAVDVIADGAAMTSVDHTVSGVLSGDTVFARSTLSTSHELTALPRSTTTTALVAPASVLTAGDVQYVTVGASDGTSDRRARYRYPGPTTFTLPPPLGGTLFSVTNGDVHITFGTLPTFDDLTVTVFSDVSNNLMFLQASPSWVAATGATQLTFDTSAPGFMPAWRVDLSQSQTTELELRHVDGPITYSTTAINSSGFIGARHEMVRERRALHSRRSI